MRWSIRTRLTTAFMGLAIGPLLLLGCMLSWRSYQTQQTEALQVQKEISQRVATQVRAFFEEIENELKVVSRVQGLSTLNRDKQNHVVSELLMYQHIFEDLILIDQRGHERAHVARSRLVTPNIDDHDRLHIVFPPVTSNRVAYSAVWFDETQGEPFITMSVPLLDVNSGQRDGMLIAVVRMKTIWHLIADIQVNTKQNAYIIDSRNMVVAHRNPSIVLRGTRFDPPDQKGVTFGLQGSQVVLAFQKVQLGNQVLTVVVEQIWSEAMALALSAMRITLMLTVIALALSSTLGFLIVRQIVRPIQKMATAARAITQGDLSQHIQANDYDEIGVLAETFNSMTTQLQSLINDLEQRVSERTNSLLETNAHLHQEIAQHKQTEIALHQAKDAAEAASQTKAEFLATMSHEIRTPLNGVLGMTGLLLDTELTETQIDYAETIRRSGEILLAIINDILDFSKIEAGKLDLEMIDFNLREIVEDVIELLAEHAYSKNLELACQFRAGVPTWVNGDPGRLRQIITNLVGNALKFTEQGEVVVDINLLQMDAGKILLRFEVIDTGIGIAPEVRDRLFDAFSQANSATTRKYGGTGLGLTISQRLVTIMEGAIGVESTPGQGSTFWFIIPFKTCSASRRTDVTIPPACQGVRVLCVDSWTTSRTILATQLTTWGLEAIGVSDGMTALEQLREAWAQGRPYSLAILEDNLPDMAGMVLAQTIKAEANLAPTRLMMLSAFKRHNLGKTGDPAHIDAFLPKPLRQAALYQGLISILGTTTEALTNNAASRDSAKMPVRINARVLIVEDNIVNQKVATRMLERMGCRVDAAAHGREALSMLTRLTYDIIFMDCQMPEMDGYTATAVIRNREAPSGYHIPIVAMTANAMQGDRERCIAAGMDDYLSKPVQSDQLLAMLQKWTSCTVETQWQPEVQPLIAPEPQPVDSSPALDTATLTELQAIGNESEPHFLRNLVETFVEDATVQIDILQTAAAAGDTTNIERAAHTLKSTSMQIGAMKMSALCLELQTLGRQNRLASADTYIERLVSEFDCVRRALAQEFPQSVKRQASPSPK